MSSKRKQKRKVEPYSHAGRERDNNSPVGLVDPKTNTDTGAKKTYEYDPQLQWSGKVEWTSFDVLTQSLHVHERIDPRTRIQAVRKRNSGEGSLLEDQKVVNVVETKS